MVKKNTKKNKKHKMTLKEKIMKILGIKSKKAFTLIELLAVIVILGLLMAIAIPSVTKYITESRKKTVVSTIGNYITAMVNEVNDLTYTFTKANTVYAVPIECI
jgi:prepilin-type N-terminal cleavage/methylation domain-containing protein